ncbi:MAG: TatD family hydrolase [Planctomycetota bacterium]
MTLIVDTHAHLTDKHFADLPKYLDLAKQAGVSRIVNVGTTLEDSLQCIQIAEKHPEVKAAVGIHPNTCCQASDGDWEQIIELANHPEVVALGETGLDKYWDDCPWESQIANFTRHWELSRRTNLPVVIHTRDCAEETLLFLQSQAKDGPLNGVMHSYAGPWDVAEGCLELGLYISFAGMVTFKNAAEVQDVARRVPSDRILVETDSPYLTPHPHRGKRPNHPALVSHTLDFLAELREVSPEELAETTTQNTFRLFGSW